MYNTGLIEKPDTIVKTVNLYLSFGDVSVLSGINLRMERGLIYTLQGGNGSGKTTLINIISGFLYPDSGSVEFKGRTIARFSPCGVNCLGIGCTFLDLLLVTQMTVTENIMPTLEKRMFSCPSKEQRLRADATLDKIPLAECEYGG